VIAKLAVSRWEGIERKRLLSWVGQPRVLLLGFT